MSHLSTVKTKIKNPDVNILKQAVNKICQQMGGKIITKVKDYYGATQDVMIGLKHDKFCPAGYGVNVNNKGELVIVGDPNYLNSNYQTHEQMTPDAFKQQVENEYNAVAFTQSLNELGFQVSETREKEKITLTGAVGAF